MIKTTYVLFFFNDPPTTEIYTLSLHDALPRAPLRQPGPPSHTRRRVPSHRSFRGSATEYPDSTRRRGPARARAPPTAPHPEWTTAPTGPRPTRRRRRQRSGGDSPPLAHDLRSPDLVEVGVHALEVRVTLQANRVLGRALAVLPVETVGHLQPLHHLSDGSEAERVQPQVIGQVHEQLRRAGIRSRARE